MDFKFSSLLWFWLAILHHLFSFSNLIKTNKMTLPKKHIELNKSEAGPPGCEPKRVQVQNLKSTFYGPVVPTQIGL